MLASQAYFDEAALRAFKTSAYRASSDRGPSERIESVMCFRSQKVRNIRELWLTRENAALVAIFLNLEEEIRVTAKASHNKDHLRSCYLQEDMPSRQCTYLGFRLPAPQNGSHLAINEFKRSVNARIEELLHLCAAMSSAFAGNLAIEM
jgi:hypothetical protein